MTSPTIEYISQCFVKPLNDSQHESKPPFYLGPWELLVLSFHYIQSGLLFAKPKSNVPQQEVSINKLMDRLKISLSRTLIHFYPLAGRLATIREENPPSCSVFVDCNNSPGVNFIHAVADALTISDVVSPTYVPLFVRSLFDLDGAVNHDGHTKPLLSVQVTELVDGLFIGCSMNHCVGDGTTFWHFFNTLSEIFQDKQISRPPVLKRWNPVGYDPLIKLPFSNESEFINRVEPSKILERIFHFSAKSIAKLKERANFEYNTKNISSFQSLSALMWRAITKARSLSHNQIVVCDLTINNRSRMEPPLSPDYVGSVVQTVKSVTTAGELLKQSLGSTAGKIHRAVVNHTDKSVRGFADEWISSPSILQLRETFTPHYILMGCSPRFDTYGAEFGLGKALTLRGGYTHKFDGNIDGYPGRKGGGSIDLFVCLQPSSMHALESDDEFMAYVSSSPTDNLN